MQIGGFHGGDPSPTLEQFQTSVASGQIHYHIASGSRPGGGARANADDTSTLAGWVAASFAAQAVDGVTMYDLTAPIVRIRRVGGRPGGFRKFPDRSLARDAGLRCTPLPLPTVLV